MNLFNTYENKNLQFLLNYLTLYEDADLCSPDEIREILYGKEQNDRLTYKENIDCILDANPYTRDEDGDDGNDNKSYILSSLNLKLLHSDANGLMKPITEWKDPLLPERTTFAERAWLKYILQKEEASYFVSPFAKEKVLALLNKETLPDISQCIFEPKKKRAFSQASVQFEENFKYVTQCIFERLPALLYFQKPAKKQNGTFCPLSIMYADDISDFSLLAYNQDCCDIELINFEDIESVELLYDNGDKKCLFDEDEEKKKKIISDCLQTHSAPEPIVLEVMNGLDGNSGIKSNNQAYDRCCRLLSGYDTENYDLPNGNTVVSISYYDFQYNDIIRKILSLGKFVRVNAPSHVRKNVIDILEKKKAMYSKNKH